jgi:hypothetical protein
MGYGKSFVTGIALVVVTALIAAAAIAGTGSAATNGDKSADQLAGTWTVTVNRPAPAPPLKSLQTFSPRGSVIEMSNEPQATRTPSFGSWERIRGRLYAATAVLFRFNPQTGDFLGSIKISRTIELAPDGNTFKHIARVSVLDPNGNVVSSFVATGAGERLRVERIADLP